MTAPAPAATPTAAKPRVKLTTSYGPIVVELEPGLFVLELFHYHLTLSGPLSAEGAAALRAALLPHLAPLIAAPMTVAAVALMGEDEAGFFHLIEEIGLRG